MDVGKVKREIEKNKAILLKYGISVDVNFVVGENVGYGESLDNYNTNVLNEIYIVVGMDENLADILNSGHEEEEIEDALALKLIESFHHELHHIVHRLIGIKSKDLLMKAISLEYLIGNDRKWYKQNYEKTCMERDCELGGYRGCLNFIKNLEVSDEEKNNLKEVFCDNFEFAYREILTKEEKETVKARSYEEKANKIITLLKERTDKALESTRGIFSKKEYIEYLEEKCKKFLKHAKPYVRGNEQIRKLLAATENLREMKEFNDNLLREDLKKYPGFIRMD